MTVIMDSVPAQLERDLSSAGMRLAEARLHQVQKDSPGNRSAVQRCLAGIDALLDSYLEAGCPP